MQAAQSLAILLLVVIIGAFSYVFYQRFASSPQALTAYLRDGEKSPAMTCTFSGGGFTGAVSGMAYLSGVSFRADLEQAVKGKLERVHIVSNDGVTFYEWSDGPGGSAYSLERSQLKDIFDYTKPSATCSPWWLPDETVFKVPQIVEFNAYSRK